MVEGAFADEWISNSYTATEELGELLPNGITSDLQPTFRELLLEPDTDEGVAAKVLARLGEDKVRRLVLELLVDPEERARGIGVRTAGYMFSEGFLAPYFRDESAHVRVAAIQTVATHAARFEDPAALTQSAFDDPEPWVRRTAYGVAGFKSLPQLAERLWVETDLPSLKAGMFRAAQELRREGVHYAGERLERGLGSKMRTLLLEGLNDEEAYLRKEIASALNRLRGQDISNAMLERLKIETEQSVRAQIVLFDGFEENAYPLLLALFIGDSDCTVRTRCAFLLERFPSAAAALAKAVAEADQTVWRAATMSLGRVGTRTELPALLSAAAHPDSRWFRSELHRAIMDISIKDAYLEHPTPPDLSQRIQVLIDELDPDPVTSWHLLACKESFNALPIFSNMLYTWAVRPDGTIIRFDREAVGIRIEDEVDPVAKFSALANGAKTYPELVALIPPPPKTIQLCRECLGKGWLEGQEFPHCSRCEGIGWTA